MIVRQEAEIARIVLRGAVVTQHKEIIATECVGFSFFAIDENVVTLYRNLVFYLNAYVEFAKIRHVQDI